MFSNDPGLTDLTEHVIELIVGKPVRIRPYIHPPVSTKFKESDKAYDITKYNNGMGVKF